MSTSKLGNTHYFIFQHRDLLWSWSISQETLENHKHKVLPHSEKNKQLGIDKITNAFTEYNSEDMEMKVYNGCIEHAFAMKGDITKGDERVHWLFITNGEKGRFLELDELEDAKLQVSYLSKSFKDSDLPNIDLITKWKDYSDEIENDEDSTEDEKGKVFGIFRKILHLEVMQHMIRVAAHNVKSDKLTDERDVYLFNDVFNNTAFHLNKIGNNKILRDDMLSLGAKELHQSISESCDVTFRLGGELYGDNSLGKHLHYTFYTTLDREQRDIVRKDTKLFRLTNDIIDNPTDNMHNIVKILKKLKK